MEMDEIGHEIRMIDINKGKGLFATKSYKEGDVIFEEKPLVSCQYSWNLEYGYLACDNCMRPLESAEENARRLTGKPNITLPYPECCEVEKSKITECNDCGIKYCSEECKIIAYQRYHRTLCLQSRERNDCHPLVRLNETWKQIQYPPETSTIMLLARMVALVLQCEHKQELLSTFSQFCNRSVNDTYEITHNLLGVKFINQIELLREMTEQALENEWTQHWFTQDGFKAQLALIGTNGQGIGTSAFGRWVQNVEKLNLSDMDRTHVDKLILKIYDEMEEVVGSFLDNEGSGLYTLQSVINHSCKPNACIEFPYMNSTLVVRARSNIQTGEEILISYLNECELERSRHYRQKSLSSFYLFKCSCEKCLSQADDPDVTSDEEEYEEETSS